MLLCNIHDRQVDQLYRVPHLVVHLSWVALEYDFLLPAQFCSGLITDGNLAESGRAARQVNPTQVHEQMGHPVPFVNKTDMRAITRFSGFAPASRI